MRILIIEDDNRVAEFLDRGMRAEGYAVQVARNGTEGLAIARAGDYTLILLDVMLPGINGMEVCQTLRSEGRYVPILMLTAMSTVEDRVTGLRCGADDYLGKPFAFEELLARIEALHRRGPMQLEADSTLKVGDLVFDRNKMRVKRAGQVLHLTAKEMALLELLMRIPGRLYSRERILANVWGVHEDPLTNVVDVYVRRLRAKLDDGHAVKLIKTVRGLGYKLDIES
jgi:DNA-binding response OmpR family regulator